MIKWPLVIGVVAAIYYLFIKKSTPIKDSATTQASGQNLQEVEEMVACSRCGVYVELDEAIVSGGSYYCSRECLRGDG